MQLWDLCIEVRGYRCGGRDPCQPAIVSDVVVVVVVVVVDVVVIVVLQKLQIIKNWVWDRSSDMQMLFEDDLTRQGHPLHVWNMSNKQGG